MKHTILFLFIGLCIASCHETDYPTFDDSVIDIYFTQDSVNYSFGVTPLSTTEHVVELPVRIIGASVKEVARNFKIEVVDKRTNAESPLHYTVPEQLTLEKDSVNAVVPVTLKRMDGSVPPVAERLFQSHGTNRERNQLRSHHHFQ